MELDGETHTSAHNSQIYIFLSYFEEKRTITERETCTGKFLGTDTRTHGRTHGRTHTHTDGHTHFRFQSEYGLLIMIAASPQILQTAIF